MVFPNQYAVLRNQVFTTGQFSIVPIRYEDRLPIMVWRNEQMYHLRQNKPLTQADQEIYFTEVLSPSFTIDQPTQILFSYLENGELVGYGGLVHINWRDRNAEISFLMNTKLENQEFEKHWICFLSLVREVAFKELQFHKIFTYAFDVRPRLYPALEKAGFVKEATLQEHVLVENEWKDVVIHSLLNLYIRVRKVQWEDRDILHEWANDHDTRNFSFNSQDITTSEHYVWLAAKLKDAYATLYICEVKGIPAAFIRFDKNPDFQLIGINVNPQFRGKKLSDKFLMHCIQALSSEQDIVAYIKPINTASIKSFEKAGFFFEKSEITEKGISLVYRFKKHDG